MIKPSTFSDQPRGVLKLPQVNEKLDPGGREDIAIAYSCAFIEGLLKTPSRILGFGLRPTIRPS